MPEGNGAPGDRPGDITQLLDRWAQGERDALDEIAGAVDRELRRIAAAFLRNERTGHTLQPTALVNEAWLRLVRQDPANLANRKHFFGLAAHLMRQILVEYARSARAQKRGGGAKPVPLKDEISYSTADVEDFLILDDALTRLGRLKPRSARVIELRYFGGLGVEEVGEILNISAATVSREQKIAEALLSQLMEEA